jgi:hypothetical protein
MKPCLDHITPAMRLAPHAEHRNCTTLEEANAYLDANQLSVLRHGFVPTKACETDVRATMVRARSRQIQQECMRYAAGVPLFLRRQAA